MTMADYPLYSYDNASTEQESWYKTLSNLTRAETVFTNSIGRTPVTATLHEWSLDSLATPADNANVEGFTPAYGKPTGRTRDINYTQIFDKEYRVTGTQDVIAKAGVTSEASHQRAKKLKELNRDIEYAHLRSTAYNSGANSATARRLKGVHGFITTNTANNATALSALKESVLLDALEDIWTNSNGDSKRLSLMVGSYEARVMAGWVSSSRPNSVDGRTISYNVQVYDSPYGLVKVLKSYIQPKTHVRVLDFSTWKRGILRPVFHTDTPKTGDFKGGFWTTEETQMCTWEKANANILSCASASS